MEQIIHIDQTYCVPGRSIMDNICLIRDVFEVSDFLGLDLGLISIDQEKSFDRVEHNYLWKIIDAFGFGTQFASMINSVVPGH